MARRKELIVALTALIPFLTLFVCFAGLRIPLVNSAFIALLTSTVLTGTVFHATSEVWNHALVNTGEITVEIGMILIGAFFFLEVARDTGVIRSLTTLLKQVNSNRVVQALLLVFPLELMVEGSSGFGTPLLVIAPLLMALEFDLWLCALLPFVNCMGIPFGALGTPIRLAFTQDPSFQVALTFLPITFLAPLLSQYLISKKFLLKESLWTLSLSLIYASASFFCAKSGPEFATLIPAFLTFCYGIVSARILFKPTNGAKLQEKWGLLVYGFLLLVLWAGKQLLLDRMIPGTHIRIFNPGYIFLLFGLGLLFVKEDTHFPTLFKATVERSKRTLLIFFCLTFVVQQLRNNGGLAQLTASLPDFLLTAGSPVIGWLGCVLVGTSTVTNLLLATVINPANHAALATGSAVGVQLAFQSLAAMRSCLQDKITEKEMLFRILPVSFGFVLILTLWNLYLQH